MSKKDEAPADAKGADSVPSRRASGRGTARNARAAADVAFVESLAQILREHELAEIEISREYGEDDELTVRISKYPAQTIASTQAAQAVMPPSPTQALPTPVLAVTDSGAAAADPASNPNAVTSPMVGTVYLAPEPNAANFVQVGDTVAEGQTLLIVEAMKTMNLIPSPRSGKVTAIFVSNGEPVEFGAPLLTLE